jgi:VWFA-related protein
MTRRLLAASMALAVVRAVHAQTFQERVRVDVVAVDVIAVDASGQPVANLRKEELALRIDGTPVEIDSLQSSGSRRKSPAAAGLGPFAGTDSGQMGASHELPPLADSSRLAIFIDLSSMSPLSQHDMYRQLTDFFQAGLPAGVSVRIERFDGRAVAAYPWSSDRNRLLEYLREIARRLAFTRGPGVNEREGMVRDVLHRFGNIDEYAHGSVAALTNAVERLAEFPGRKTLLFLTDGGPFLGSISLTPEALFCRNRDPFAIARAHTATGFETQNLLDELTRRAARHSIVLVPVNSDPLRAESIEFGIAMLADRADLNGTMENLAEMTGGQAVLNGGYLSKRLPDFLRRSAEGYVLAFRDPFHGDGEYHRIEISTHRPRVALHHRAGYQALEPGISRDKETVARPPQRD